MTIFAIDPQPSLGLPASRPTDDGDNFSDISAVERHVFSAAQAATGSHEVPQTPFLRDVWGSL